MDPARLRALLERLRKDELTIEAVLEELRTLPFRRIGDTGGGAS